MSNFAYAATRARARRARLLPPEVFGQLLNMELEEIARYIQDLEYRREIARYGASLRGADLLEAALLDNRATEVGEIIGFCTGELRQGIEAYAEIYRVRGIKVLLRGIFDGLGGEELLRQVSPLTERDRELYTQMAATDSVEAAVELLEGTRYHDVVQNALEQRQSDSLQPIEDALDRAYYENLASSLPAG